MMEPMAPDPLAQIRQLYFKATPATIERDLTRAIDLLKSMPEAERERATVFMEGLNELRKEFRRGRRARPDRRRPR
jgi:hypothetical protein